MGEYECTICAEMFHLDEPSEGLEECDKCIEQYKKDQEMDKKVEVLIKDISSDTILIEVQGGHVTEVHNDSNGYMLFDWDSIGEQDTIEFHKKVLKRLLER